MRHPPPAPTKQRDAARRRPPAVPPRSPRLGKTRPAPAVPHGVTLGPAAVPERHCGRPAPAGDPTLPPARPKAKKWGRRRPRSNVRGCGWAGSAPGPVPTHMCGFRWKALRMSFTTRCTSTATSSGDSAIFRLPQAGRAGPGQAGLSASGSASRGEPRVRKAVGRGGAGRERPGLPPPQLLPAAAGRRGEPLGPSRRAGRGAAACLPHSWRSFSGRRSLVREANQAKAAATVNLYMRQASGSYLRYFNIRARC